MSKRFTDTNKYRKTFFRGLDGAYKLLWDYLYHDCNHAGIWIADFEIAQIYLGADMQVSKDEALRVFNEGETRIIEINDGKSWFIKPFVDFQYGELNPKNRVHNSVLKELEKHSQIKGHVSPLQGAMDKDKDKDKDKDISLDDGLLDWVAYVRASHEAFQTTKIRDCQIASSLNTQPDKTKWKDAIDAMSRHYAGVDMRKPLGHLENYLYGKVQDQEKKPEPWETALND